MTEITEPEGPHRTSIAAGEAITVLGMVADLFPHSNPIPLLIAAASYGYLFAMTPKGWAKEEANTPAELAYLKESVEAITGVAWPIALKHFGDHWATIREQRKFESMKNVTFFGSRPEVKDQ